MGAAPAIPYRGRFAPTPSGPLHAGSVVAALASYLDARAHRGTWLVRIEDTDTPRCSPQAAEFILQQLDRLGLRPDEPVQWQSRRAIHYDDALTRLREGGWAYGCSCSRHDVDQALREAGVSRARHAPAVYPGTCRKGTPRAVRAWRVRVDSMSPTKPETSASPPVLTWVDRRLGPQSQDLPHEVGDFIVRRADGLWAYQLAVVVDDALQGVTDIVRGQDLADNTPRQIYLQRALGVCTPRYLHTPLVWAADGQKLSKQTGAQAVDVEHPLVALQAAADVLGLAVAPESPQTEGVTRWLERATQAWGQRWA